MPGAAMQPTPSAIEREFEALRDIRRRSSAQGGPGTLILDPDLPAEPPSSTPPLSPQAWAAAATTDITTSPTQSREDDSGSSESGTTLADDPYHLFWLPAHLHPEIAPREFRAFLKEHAHEGTASQSPVSLSRSSSAASTSSGLGRKSSMLRKQYKPRENDGVEDEHVVPLRRNKSIYQNDGPQLTINDLQKLEELADEDPSKLSRVIRRSLSLNVAPSFLDDMDGVPETDDADAPIIVPRPNQILRRAARTKIRKPNLVGDGNGHRFPATRRKSSRAGDADSVGDKEDTRSERPPVPSHISKNDEFVDETSNRRMTYTEESSIYDAYADPNDEKDVSFSTDASHSQALLDALEHPAASAIQVSEVIPPRIAEPDLQAEPEPVMQQSQPQPQPLLYQPQPQHHLSTPVVQQNPTQTPSRTPSPDGSTATHLDDARRPTSRSAEYLPYHSPSPTITEKRKGKDKKGLLGKFGVTDKSFKKGSKEGKEKEKETGFFGSIFGGKKKHEEPAPTNIGGGAGPATAAALLGASKSSKSYQPPVSPVLLGGNPYARYPIHVERAVYRLSHIKLANPRRPLYEQVLISNLMFWYLGVINKTQQGPGQAQNQQNQQQQQQQQSQTQPGQADGQENKAAEEERLERERKETEDREAREKAEREREATERAESRKEGRKGSLTKAPPGSAVPANRRAEIPVKGPQYGLQHQVIEQEYGQGSPSLGSGSPAMSRTSSAPSPSNSASGYSQRPYSSPPSRQPANSAPTTYAHVDENGDFYYDQVPPSGSRLSNGPPTRSTSPGLPPGAMAPMSSTEHLWMASTSSQEPDNYSPRSSSTSPPRSNSFDADASHQQRPRPVRSPPPANHNSQRNGVEWDSGGGSKPSRSLSANAVAPSHSGQSRHHNNNHSYLKKKAPSASGTTSSSAGAAPARRPRTADGEEEDMPLAVWQQRRK